MLPLLRSELFRLRRRPLTWWLIVVVIIAVVGIYAILWSVLATQDSSDTQDLRTDLTVMAARDNGLDITNFFAAIVTVILSASLVGTEYGWGTIRALLPRARSRIALMAAKLTAIAIFDVVLVLVGYVAALGMSWVITSAENLRTGFGPDAAQEISLAILRNVYVLLPYSALAFVIAVLTRSNAAGIAIGLAVLLAESIAVGILTSITDTFDWVGDVLFSQNMAAISNLNNLRGGGDSDLPSAGQAFTVLALWLIALIALSLTIFQRRDVTSG